MSASKRLHSGIIRRWVRLQERVLAYEDEQGPDARLTEMAVRDLIDFEVDLGSGLELALQACPLPRVHARVREEDFADGRIRNSAGFITRSNF